MPMASPSLSSLKLNSGSRAGRPCRPASQTFGVVQKPMKAITAAAGVSCDLNTAATASVFCASWTIQSSTFVSGGRGTGCPVHYVGPATHHSASLALKVVQDFFKGRAPHTFIADSLFGLRSSMIFYP
jgi:hypothetical protein